MRHFGSACKQLRKSKKIMVKRNPHFGKLSAEYLFLEVKKRKEALLNKQPNAKIISLGIGDTTEPIPKVIAEAMEKVALDLSTKSGYHGYGPYNGLEALREKITEKYYPGLVDKDEIFISDGIKSDMARLQILFGEKVTVAVQDPAYPAYISSSVITGKSGFFDPEQQYVDIVYMPCTAENDFFPDLSKTKRADIIFFCSPNNPTGSVPTHEQLEELVQFAKKNDSIIIFDAAYRAFIKDPNLPKSIYEIDGARGVAIEFGSFSKYAGFTGIRLGWSVFPKELHFSEGLPVINDWERVLSSCYNGTSIISQMGGIASLENEGEEALNGIIDHYLGNAKILKDCIEKIGWPCFGGDNAPYLWIKVPGKKSWDAFEDILYKTHIVTTPGVGFGPSGEGYIRLSAFGHRADIEEAATRLLKFK